jgi:hypothetical protein
LTSSRAALEAVLRTRCFAKTPADEEINRGARNALHFCALARFGIARVNEIATGLRAATPKPRKTRRKCFSYIRAAAIEATRHRGQKR